MCSLTQSTVTRLLSGKRSPQLVTLVKICQAFKVKPSFFVRELQEDDLSATPTVADPALSYGPMARALLTEIQSLDEDDLSDVLEFARFRKRQLKRKKA
jgi:transcriptional regulator with XRE-family HTH domain